MNDQPLPVMGLEGTPAHAISQSHVPNHHKRRGNIRHSNTSQGLVRPIVQRTPLRAVDDNASLLKSPGPLESMLKTTTETGDIGLFTIGTGPPPSTYYHPPPRRRMLSEIPFASSGRSRRVQDRHFFQDDRLELPSSYRDTTSEILSLYDSEVHISRIFTPSCENEQRAYSLEPSTSRYLTSPKLMGTFQGASERPTSPFPYPTRPKRPGMRPVSPALGDSGTAFCVRRLEVDRSCQSLLYDGHRKHYTYSSRHQPPLSLRSEPNRSTTSLPSRSSPGLHRALPSSYRSHTPTSLRSRTPRSMRTSWKAPTDRGLRSPSVGSILEMYHKPTTSNSFGPPLRSNGSFYYDYSEEFEKDAAPVFELGVPLCPVPQRAPSLGRPMVLRAEDKGIFAKNESGRDDTKDPKTIGATPEENSTGENVAVLGMSGEPGCTVAFTKADCGIDEFNKMNLAVDDFEHIANQGKTQIPNNLGSESTQLENDNVPVSIAQVVLTKLKEHPEQSLSSTGDQAYSKPCTLGISSPLEDVALPAKFLSPAKRRRRSNTVGAVAAPRASVDLDKHESCLSLNQSRGNFEPESFESRKLSTSSDRFPESQLFRKPSTRPRGSEASQLIRDSSQSRNSNTDCLHPQAQDVYAPISSQDETERPADINKLYHKRHRRNLAVTHISAAKVPHVSDDHGATRPYKSSPEVLSPEPISSSRQLKAKESIPQLMKALPPLPGQLGMYGSGTCSDETIEGSAKAQWFHTSGEIETNGECPASQPDCSPTKLKLRLKPVPGTPPPDNEASGSLNLAKVLSLESTGSPAHRKLRIKLPRNAALPALIGKYGTVLRSPALKQCNSLADLEHCARRDMFTDQCQLKEAFAEPSGTSEVHYLDVSHHYEVRAEQFEVAQAEQDTANGSIQPTPPSGESGFRRTRSMMLKKNQHHHDGLRQKLSFLRLRLGTAHVVQEAQKETLLSLGTKGGPEYPLVESPETDIKRTQPQVMVGRTGKAQLRVRKWAKGARNAVRKAIRKTLDRSTNFYS